MANSRRIQKVAALIRRETSQILINQIRDERIHQSMITITEVELSGDLQYCKIFVSLFGDENQKNEVLSGLDAASGFLKGELARRLQMRRAPEIVFKLDRGMEKGASVMQLLGKLEQQRNNKEKISLDVSEDS
tara:strand:- start:148 stop:546 length:399 start_codon:yes stop_codon:yes gene_type:complete